MLIVHEKYHYCNPSYKILAFLLLNVYFTARY